MTVLSVLALTVVAVVLATWVASIAARHRIARDRRIDRARRVAADAFRRDVAASGAAYHANRDCARSIHDGFITPVTWDDKPAVRLPEPSKEAS